MKKLISILVSILMFLTLVGCEDKQETASANDAVEDNESIEVDEKLLTVDITLPGSFFESFDTTAEDYVKSVEEDEENKDIFDKVVVNDDGSVTVTMSRTKYNEYLKEMADGINDSIQEILDDKENYPDVVDIKANNDFTNFDVTLTSEELGLSESFIAFGLYMNGAIYQMFTEDPKMSVTVNYYDQNGKLIDSTTMNPDTFSENTAN